MPPIIVHSRRRTRSGGRLAALVFVISAPIAIAADDRSGSFPSGNAAMRSIGPGVSVEPGERPYSQIDRDIDAFLRREARAQDDGERIAALEDLCALFVEIKRDPRLERSETLQGYKAKVHSKLMAIRRELERIEAREAKRREREARTADERQQAARRGLPDASRLDDSPTGFAGGERGFEPGDAFVGQYPYLSAAGGGGAALLLGSSSHYGGASVAGNASDLIELIQRTIHPDHWDVNGGPGTIFFYQPLNALVVRANSEVHSGLGVTLDELRRAGGR